MKYDNLKDSIKEEFGVQVRKLFSQSFVIRSLDFSGYQFITNYEASINEYIKVIGYQLRIDSENGIIGLEETNPETPLKYTFKDKIKKSYTAVLVCIWTLYLKKLEELADDDHMVFTLKELNDLMNSWSLTKKLTAVEIEDAIRLFSKYNLVKIINNNFRDENTKVQMLRSLGMCMNTQEFKDTLNALREEYKIGK